MPLAIAEFIKQLEDSGIVDGATLREVAPPGGQSTLTDVARELVKQRKLTRFQAEEAARGRAQRLVLGNYILLDRIGAGGMGQVFKARHRRMDREVAIKVLAPDLVSRPGAIARFEREVRAAAKISHPNIITAFDADHAGSVHFLVMEYVQGGDLSALVKKQGPLSVSQAIDVVSQAARGLEAAHAAGIVHRDIKPANLLLDVKGTVKILDMGLARLGDAADAVTTSDLTNTGAVMGTVDYMAPEQAVDCKHADGRADIYALGCSLYWLLTGKPPYGGDTMMAKLLAHRGAPIPSLRSDRPDVPEAVESLFRRMVAKSPDDRYATIAELESDLKRIRAGTLPEDRYTPGAAPGAGPKRRQAAEAPAEGTIVLSDDETDDTGHVDDFMPDLESVSVQMPAWKRTLSSLLDEKGRGVLWAIVSTGAAGAAILAVFLASKQRPTGSVVVEINQPDAVVRVLDDTGEVETSKDGGAGKVTINVDPGRHRLVVTKEGFEDFGEAFDVAAGGRTEISARLVPVASSQAVAAVAPVASGTQPQPTPASEVEAAKRAIGRANMAAERRAAAWAVKHAAGLEVLTAGGRKVIAAGGEPPQEDFAVTAIRFPQRVDWAQETLEFLPDLVALESLDVFDTAIPAAALKSVARCRSLLELSLQRCDVDDGDVALLGPLESLTALRLPDNPLTDAAIPSIAQHGGLMELNLGDTPVRCADLGPLESCDQLADLQLGGCWLGATWADQVARVASLRGLDVSFTNARDEDIAKLRALPLLEDLSLRGAAVGDGAVESLIAMPSLSTCWVEMTALSESGARRLAEGSKGRVAINADPQFADRTMVPDRLLAAIEGGEWTKVDFSNVSQSLGVRPMVAGNDPAYEQALRDSGTPPSVRAGRPFVVRRNRLCTLPSPTAADVVLRVRFRIIPDRSGPRSASFRLRESAEGAVGVVIQDSGYVAPGVFLWRDKSVFTVGNWHLQYDRLPDGPLTATLAVVGDRCHLWFNGKYFRFAVDERLASGGMGFGWLDGITNMVVEDAEYQILD